ncbi:diguanylate cyclase with PAS/PAC and GAF sensors [Pseudomonas sp. GV071]|nr:diguanylate cyclase with PAS/PAC and GAF sensors [Pseudomonas sp. GV071]
MLSTMPSRHAPSPSFIDLMLDAVCVVDRAGHFVYVSAAFEQIFGYTPDEIVGRQMLDLVHPDDRERTLKAASEIMAGDPKLHFENRYLRKDGQEVHIMWSARWSPADQLRVAVARDISARKQAESMQAALYAISEAAHTAESLSTLFERIHQIIVALLPALNFSVSLRDEPDGELTFAYHVDEQPQAHTKTDISLFNQEILRSGHPLLLTRQTQPWLPKRLHRLLGSDGQQCWLGVPLQSHQSIIGTLVLKRYAGSSPYTDKDQELLQFVSTQIAAAIERKQFTATLLHIAQHDQLTGLPNRALLHDRLHTALARARREYGQVALLYLDLDKFKAINDQHGHATGDLLLQAVAARLKACVREVDTVARFGGDEFVLLLENVDLPEHALGVAQKILATLSQPMELGGVQVQILPSIGMAFYPEHGDAPMQLLKQADSSMYHAKNQGGNRVAYHPHS